MEMELETTVANKNKRSINEVICIDDDADEIQEVLTSLPQICMKRSINMIEMRILLF